MIGATSPKLHLELMVARLLVESSPAAGVGAVAGFDTVASPPTQPAMKNASGAQPAAKAAAAGFDTATSSPTQPTTKVASLTQPAAAAAKANPIEPTTAGLTKAWPAVLEHLQKANRMAWIVVNTASVREYDGEVITLVFPSETDAASFRPQPGVPGGVHEKLRESIIAVTGESPKFRVSVEGTPTAAIETVPVAKPAPVVVPDAPGDDWAVVDIPGADEASSAGAGSADEVSTSSTGERTSSTGDGNSLTGDGNSLTGDGNSSTGESSGDDGRYGESVVRDLLGATLLKEERTGPIETVVPADTGAQVLPDAGEA
jgi:DNA polymerase-3 subunit gamma/tau